MRNRRRRAVMLVAAAALALASTPARAQHASRPWLIAALTEARGAGKPVIALKVGTSEAGQAAAASHTGAMAGSDAVFDALLARYGAVRVRSIEELIDFGHAASILLPDRLPKGPRLAVVTASGGFGVLLADAAHVKVPHARLALGEGVRLRDVQEAVAQRQMP